MVIGLADALGNPKGGLIEKEGMCFFRVWSISIRPLSR